MTSMQKVKHTLLNNETCYKRFFTYEPANEPVIGVFFFHINFINVSTRLSDSSLIILHMGDTRNAHKISMGKPEAQRPLGRPRRRWEDNIRIYLREIVWGGMDWIDLGQDRDQWRALANTIMNLRVP
jgi:hypothetical protein